MKIIKKERRKIERRDCGRKNRNSSKPVFQDIFVRAANKPSKREFSLMAEQTEFSRLSTRATVLLAGHPRYFGCNWHVRISTTRPMENTRSSLAAARSFFCFCRNRGKCLCCDDSAASRDSQRWRKSARCLYCFQSISLEGITRVLSETQLWNLFAYFPAISFIRMRFVQFYISVAMLCRFLLGSIILIYTVIGNAIRKITRWMQSEYICVLFWNAQIFLNKFIQFI